MKTQFDLFLPPAIERRAEIPRGAVFQFGGRFLKVFRVFGDVSDKSAPVIVEELMGFGNVLPGQYALWSQDAVSRCLVHDYGPTIGVGPYARPTRRMRELRFVICKARSEAKQCR